MTSAPVFEYGEVFLASGEIRQARRSHTGSVTVRSQSWVSVGARAAASFRGSTTSRWKVTVMDPEGRIQAAFEHQGVASVTEALKRSSMMQLTQDRLDGELRPRPRAVCPACGAALSATRDRDADRFWLVAHLQQTHGFSDLVLARELADRALSP